MSTVDQRETHQAPPRRRALRPGELLAISPDVIQEDRGAFFWLFGPPVPRNERIGAVSVVRVNGPLEYHDDGFGDSYEWLCSRVEKAMTGQDACEAYERDHRWDDDYEPMTAAPPSCVVLRLDSPGGVVAGLEQTVNQLRALSDKFEIPLYAYVDETAYSAAYALCCACSRVVLPPSGFCGSIGVISTMVDQTAKDAKDGYKFVILTSGERKADGHPHAPITDEMVAEEQPRVATLAKQFFGMVKRARGLKLKEVAAFQAKRFLGKEAVAARVADEIKPWAQFISELNAPPSADASVAQVGSQTPVPSNALVASTPKSVHTDPRKSSQETPTMDALAKLTMRIASVEASLKTEKDPKKLAALASDLEAYKKTKHMIEKHETEEGADEDEEDEEDEDGAAKGDETDRGDDSDEEDEDDDDDEDDSSKSKEERKGKRAALIAKYLGKGKIDQAQATALGRQKLETVKASLGIKVKATAPGAAVVAASDAAILSFVRRATGKTDAASALAALRGLVAGAGELKKDVDALKLKDRKSSREGMIEKALHEQRITPAEAKTLGKKKAEFVEQYLSMRTTKLVDAQGSDSPVPDVSGSQLPKDLQAIIAAAQQANPGLKAEDVQADLARVNGAGKRV
jgi:ClpP class serine protease